MQKIIRLGDKTSHGGTVVSATSHVTVGGIPVARVGDKCTCPKRGHNNCVIVEGDPNWTIDGIPVALEGHKISCGAVLIASAPNTGRVYEASDGASVSAIPLVTNNSIMNLAQAATPSNSLSDFDEHFVLIDDRTDEQVQNFEYYLATQSETAQSGVTDDDGRTLLIHSDIAEAAMLKARQTKIMIG